MRALARARADSVKRRIQDDRYRGSEPCSTRTIWSRKVKRRIIDTSPANSTRKERARSVIVARRGGKHRRQASRARLTASPRVALAHTRRARFAAIGERTRPCRATSFRPPPREARVGGRLSRRDPQARMGGFNGDPSSALLEVLDKHRTRKFRDNYSRRVDLAKGWSSDRERARYIPGAARSHGDHPSPGYPEEKLHDREAIPVSAARSERPSRTASLSDDALRASSYYTREAGGATRAGDGLVLRRPLEDARESRKP